MEIRHYLDDRGRDVFQRWLDGLGDIRGRVAIARRMSRVEQGNLGDHKYLGDGISELRFDLGPGYRVYYAMDGETIVLLLGGGDKDHKIEISPELLRHGAITKKGTSHDQALLQS